jgi:hypothetical protein
MRITSATDATQGGGRITPGQHCATGRGKNAARQAPLASVNVQAACDRAARAASRTIQQCAARLARDAAHINDAQRLADALRCAGHAQAARRAQHQRPHQQERACTSRRATERREKEQLTQETADISTFGNSQSAASGQDT